MKATYSPIIQGSELQSLHNSKDLVIVDASNGIDAKSNYQAKHLEGAIFVDLNTQLAEIKDNLAIGGRHPLPRIDNFTRTLAELGIAPKSHVIIYDDKNGSNAAARFWWMLKAVGHEKVQVLNGGLHEAEKHHFPISSKIETRQKASLFKVDHWKLPLANMEEVENFSKNDNHLVIDVREPKRYSGETEPIDLIAGHIPGAINAPFHENLDENGLFLNPQLLKMKYQKLIETVRPENIIIHCGSGVTACHTILAMAYGGLEIPKLYVGSWSEWSRNNKPIINNASNSS